MSSLALILEKDLDIIQEYTVGNREIAVTAFVRKYQKFVYSTALRFLKSYDDADDASQEVFIKAIDNLQKFRGDSSLKTWLYRITSNVCTSMLRKKKIFSIFTKEDTDDFFNIQSNDSSPAQKVENQEFEKKFLIILSKLPEKQRETFALRYFDNLTYEEISNMLGTTVGGLKANYYQATRKIAELLNKESKNGGYFNGKFN